MTGELKVAVLGVGTMGSFHVESLSRRTRGARVTVVSDFSDEQAHRVADPIGARVVADPLAAIAADDVDAVVIASPGTAHEEQVLACLEAGKPVLCEKPLTTEAATAAAVHRRETELGRRLIQVGFMRRFDHEYAALQKMIAGDELGAPLMLHCTHRNPAVPEFFDSEFMIRDSVVHEADSARFLLGEEITAVSVVRGRPTGSAPAGVSDPMLVLFEAESGALVTIEIFVRTGIAYEVRTEVVAERGSALIGLDQNVVDEAGRRDVGRDQHAGLRRPLRPGLRRPDAALGGRGEPGRHHGRRRRRRPGQLGRLRGRRDLRGRRGRRHQGRARGDRDGGSLGASGATGDDS